MYYVCVKNLSDVYGAASKDKSNLCHCTLTYLRCRCIKEQNKLRNVELGQNV
jgi:hypothetical protein